ncbi:carbohydrate ABC transporter permease [Streptomyces johnsoniae]|uniref:Sugar ABC transporter permease n=1 Tax=Streptomyces johnsoniae TaxID=3075532 RepID=A0ABU2S1B7_9ACTN|nr:sugar ABC transporter permease [Streptomyces sp. DSM 41886]MDT0442702.1 sugar ABC transporter permease [Streptomyces sp. DSM 41886]
MTRRRGGTVAARSASSAPSPSTPAASARAPRRRAEGPARRRSLTGLLLISPALLLVAVFFLAPLGLTVWMSFHKWPLLGTPEWSGFDNYAAMPGDRTFLDALGYTVLYTVIITPLLLFIGLGLAFLVRDQRRGVGIFRTVWFLPYVFGFASSAYLFLWLFDSSVGFVDPVLMDLGLTDAPVQWMNSADTATTAVIVMVVWKVVGFQMLLLMAGLQSVPDEINEAALMDGSGRWSTLLRITLPLLRRHVALVLVFSVSGSMLAFEQFFIMTGGGPGNETLTVVNWIYNSSFANFQLGYGSALSVLLLVLLMIVNGIQLFLLRERD